MICYCNFVMTKLIFEKQNNSLFDREMKVFYVTQVLGQGINIKTICPNYILKFRKNENHIYWLIDQDRNCHRKSSLLNCRSLLL